MVTTFKNQIGTKWDMWTFYEPPFPMLTNMIILATPLTGHVICDRPFTYNIKIYLGYQNLQDYISDVCVKYIYVL